MANSSDPKTNSMILVPGRSPASVQCRDRADGGKVLDVDLPQGLYQFSVIADAHEFNWEELYITFNIYGNVNQRTGPWDFNELDGNKPLVPSYRVSLDGRKIGLWFFERVSLPDIENRRFRGRMAFQIEREGQHTLEFIPYRAMPVRCLSAKLERDPENQLAPLPPGIRNAEGIVPVSRWTDPKFWDEQRRRLEGSHAIYRKPMRWLLDQTLQKKEPAEHDLPQLIAAFYLENQPVALERALQVVDRLVEKPFWGNPNPDAYSHNGDMGAAYAMRALAWVWHTLGDHLGEERRERLIRKLTLQGNIFCELALLNRDYWGGSILQDHGRRAWIAFATAALHLLGIIPDARRWCMLATHAVQRSIDAMPRDGVIPPSSYGSPSYYLDESIHYRDAWLALTGRDIFDEQPFRPIIDFVHSTLFQPKAGLLPSTYFNHAVLIGSLAFFNSMAAKHRDGRAAWLHRHQIEIHESLLRNRFLVGHFEQGALWGFLTYDPAVESIPAPPRPAKILAYFEDSGFAHFHDDAEGVALNVQCGPWCGYNAYRRAQGPCDRMNMSPGAGHFSLLLDGQSFLVTPIGAYRLTSDTRSILLVDGRGQHGDVGYPMSIPSWLDHGEEIEWVRWDAATGTGVIRLKLHPAYPAEFGMLQYTRELHVGRSHEIICRDQVLFDKPRRLSWLFQIKRKQGAAFEQGLRHRIGPQPGPRFREEGAGHGPTLWIEAKPLEIGLQTRIEETELVWSYSALEHDPFDRIRYDTIEPVSRATVDFILIWT